MRIEAISYSADVAMTGMLYLPDRRGRLPGVLVFSDIFGLGDHARERAQRLAELGYAAFAADLHGGQRVLGTEAAMAELGKFCAEPDRPCARGEAALKAFVEHPSVDPAHIAAIGFCYGGTLSLEIARRGGPLAAVVGFHSGLATSNPAGGTRIRGKILACIGSEDPAVPAEQRAAFEAEMRAAGVDWQLNVYGGVYHTFTDRRSDAWRRPDFARYNADADRRSWTAMRLLLEEVLGGGEPQAG